MASTLPYLSSYKNVELLFNKIQSAKQPGAFNQSFLGQTLGLKSSSDRALIPLLRTLGFVDSAGKPTASYSALKNPATRGAAVADAIRRGYRPLFEANENAHTLTGQELRGLIAQVAGTDDDITSKVAGTFNALLRVADFSVPVVPDQMGDAEQSADAVGKPALLPPVPAPPGNLRPEFHYNIQVHLPSNATEEAYLSIFNALRKAFQ